MLDVTQTFQIYPPTLEDHPKLRLLELSRSLVVVGGYLRCRLTVDLEGEVEYKHFSSPNHLADGCR